MFKLFVEFIPSLYCWHNLVIKLRFWVGLHTDLLFFFFKFFSICTRKVFFEFVPVYLTTVFDRLFPISVSFVFLNIESWSQPWALIIKSSCQCKETYLNNFTKIWWPCTIVFSTNTFKALKQQAIRFWIIILKAIPTL